MATTILSSNDPGLRDLAIRVGLHLLVSQRRIVTAESCTGGWIGKVFTDVAGSSSWYLGGAVVYSNELKQKILGVPAETLARNGAVSEAVVRAMAEGALGRLGGNVAVAVSGIAGPDGGTPEKPVGTVWLAWCYMRDGYPETVSARHVFLGDREQVRRQTVGMVLERVLTL